MAEDIQQAKDDISYIKGFLKDDGPAPVLIGYFYLLQGVVVALVALRRYPIAMGWDVPGFLTAFMPWDMLALVLVGFAIISTVMWRQRKCFRMVKPQDLSAGTRASNAAWGAVTFAVAAGFVCLGLSGIAGAKVAGLILFAVCWSVGWFVTFAVHRVGWHRLVAFGFIVFAVAVAKAAGGPVLILVVAAGWLLLFTLPGYLILRDARSYR